MDYNEKVRLVALQTKENESEYGFSAAFNIAFQKSDFDGEIYHMVRLGVKSFFRCWKNEEKQKEFEQKSLLAQLQQTREQANEHICPVD